jgi:hypothetical protein
MKLRGNFTLLAAAGAAITLGVPLMAGAATSAQAVPVANYQVINGNSSNSCLQVNMSGAHENLVLGNCDRSAKQVWRVFRRRLLEPGVKYLPRRQRRQRLHGHMQRRPLSAVEDHVRQPEVHHALRE